MIRRISLIVLLVCVLGGLLVAGQMRGQSSVVSGFIEADEIRVGSRVGGRVAEVLVQEGELVTQGQVLVRLEPYDIRERLREAEANLAARKAEHDKLKAGLRPQEIAQAKARAARVAAVLKKLKDGPLPEEIAAAESRLQLARAQLDRAKKSHDRTVSLYNQNTNAVGKDELDQAIEVFRVAEANEQVRKEELHLMQKGTRAEDISAAEAELLDAQLALELATAGFRSEEIAVAAASVEAAEAAVSAVQKQLAELEIRADTAGTVNAIELRPGDLVPMNGPVLSLIDHSRMWVRAYLPENRLGPKLGERFAVTVDSFPREVFQAELTFVSTQAEFTPRNVQTPEERSKQVFRVKLHLLEGLDRLRPGMSADVRLQP
ncbi:MAG: HlyD family efflux transporter periplasmic adaptor subunit [Pirellulales bacterium]